LIEFSFFLILVSIFIALVFLLGKIVFRWANKKRKLLYLLCLLSLALTFFFLWTGLFLLLVFSAPLLINTNGFFAKRKSSFALLLFAVALIVFIVAYLDNVTDFWGLLTEGFHRFLFALNLRNGYGFMRAFEVIRYFRYYYPSLITGVLWLSFCTGANLSEKRYTFWYRYLKFFDHRIVIFILIATGSMILSYVLNAPLQTQAALLNLCLLFAVPYVIFGYLTLIYGFKKKFKLPYILGAIIMYVVVIALGPYFLFPVVFMLGLGISDIWMDYHNRVFRKLF
jgi:hypothetical protein